METLQHIEYLISWLDGQPVKLSPEAYSKLRFEAAKELAKLREALNLLPEPPPAVEAPPTPPVIPDVTRAPAELGLEIANLLATHKLLQDWTQQDLARTQFGVLLGTHLEDSLKAFQAELGDRPTEIDPLPISDTIEFALKSIPGWAALLELDPKNEAEFKNHLRAIRLKQRELEAEAPPIVVEVEPAEMVQLEAEAPPPIVSQLPKRPPLTLPKVDWAKLWERTWGGYSIWAPS
jgi:hypothetical protein